jgi:molybdopterin synthase sulfur carrier subunit
MARVRLFGRVSDAAQGQKELRISSRTLRETLDHLKRTFGEQFIALVFDEAGNTRPFINIFVNKKHMNQLQGLDTEVSDEDEVLIVPAVAGG